MCTLLRRRHRRQVRANKAGSTLDAPHRANLLLEKDTPLLHALDSSINMATVRQGEQRSLECDICLERFDRTDRRPKLLPCGHTYCLRCLGELQRAVASGHYSCPICRRRTRKFPQNLADNFDRLSLLEPASDGASTSGSGAVAAGPSPRFWCVDCEAVATKECEEEHVYCRLRKHRAQQLQPVVATLQRAADLQRRLAERMADAQAAMSLRLDAVVKAGEAVQQTLSVLDNALELVGPEWDKAAAVADRVGAAMTQQAPRLAADEDALHMLESARRCQLAVQGADGERWSGDLALQPEDADSRAALGALLALRRAGKLLPDKDHKRASVSGEKPSSRLKPSAYRRDDEASQLASMPSLCLNGVTEDSASTPRGQCNGPQECNLPGEAEGIIPEIDDAPGRQLRPVCYERDRVAQEELLERVRLCGVRRIVNLSCHEDPDWTLDLLRAALGGLEELSARWISKTHLLTLTSAPRLRRLWLLDNKVYRPINEPPFLELPPLAQPGSLQWLHVEGLPRVTLRSLLRAHASTLQTLLLEVGALRPMRLPGYDYQYRDSDDEYGHYDDWPRSCDNLHALLAECSLTALRKLVLMRYAWMRYFWGEDEVCVPTCSTQLRAVRRALPGVEVLCNNCDQVPEEDF